MTDGTTRPLSAERSNLVAAVYGDGTPPTWFTDALGRFEAAARASAGPAPRWKFDSQCEITNENHEQGEACAPFTPHSHRAGQIKWARPFPPLDETDLGAAYVELQERFIAFGDEVGARASAGPLDVELLTEVLRGAWDGGDAGKVVLGILWEDGGVSRGVPSSLIDGIAAEYNRLAAARLPAAGHTHRQLWCERNESSASAHGHDDGCYHDHLRDSADSAPTPAAPGESE